MTDPGRDLKRARRAAHLSQRELAARTGIDQAVIARIEAGTTSPRVETLTRLLAATGHRYELVSESPPQVDRAALRAAMALGDDERERYFLRSNANMLALVADAKRSP
jgi:transcriptional regulator with XRE-family HTH domain